MSKDKQTLRGGFIKVGFDEFTILIFNASNDIPNISALAQYIETTRRLLPQNDVSIFISNLCFSKVVHTKVRLALFHGHLNAHFYDFDHCNVEI